jgi:hypothetical protein
VNLVISNAVRCGPIAENLASHARRSQGDQPGHKRTHLAQRRFTASEDGEAAPPSVFQRFPLGLLKPLGLKTP